MTKRNQIYLHTRQQRNDETFLVDIELAVFTISLLTFIADY